MGVTRFPNGIEVGDSTTSSTFSIGGTTTTPLNYASAGREIVGGTIIVPSSGSTAFIPSGLTAAEWVAVSPYGQLSSTAGTVGGFTNVTATVAGGTVTIYSFDQMGTASSNAGTASYVAIGTM